MVLHMFQFSHTAIYLKYSNTAFIKLQSKQDLHTNRKLMPRIFKNKPEKSPQNPKPNHRSLPNLKTNPHS